MSGLRADKLRFDILSIKIRDLILAFFVALLAISNTFQGIYPIFAYADEIVTLILAAWAIPLLWNHKISERLLSSGILTALLCFIAFVIVGLLGNYLSGIQPNSLAIWTDLFTVSKFLIALTASLIVFKDSSSFEQLLIKMARPAVLGLTACMLVNSVFDIGMTHEIRFGFRAFTFYFQHPTMFAAFMVGVTAIFLVHHHQNRFYIFLCLVLLFSTMRFKAWGFALLVIVVLLLFRKRNKIPFGFIMLGALSVFFLARDQISIYFLEGETARSVLLTKSLEVANLYAPIGSGFATYASNASGLYYSDLYYILGIDRVFGLHPEDYRYLVDSFWPIIIGQFGWLGLLIFSIIIWQLFITISKTTKHSPQLFWPAILIFIYFLIASTSESAFFAPYSPYLAMILAFIMTSTFSNTTLETQVSEMKSSEL